MRRISYSFHIIRMPEGRSLKELITRGLRVKSGGRYMTGIKEDPEDIKLNTDDA